MVNRRSLIRGMFLALIILSLLLLTQSYVTATDHRATDSTSSLRSGSPVEPPTARSTGQDVQRTPTQTRTPGILTATQTPTLSNAKHQLDRSNVSDGISIPEANALTVVTTQGVFISDETAEILAFTEQGEVVYQDDRYDAYFDIDPVDGLRYTVEYVAAKQFNGNQCSEFTSRRCTRNVIERVNLSTGVADQLFAEKTPKLKATRWHDADRLNDTHVVLADMYRDSVRIINLSSGETTWEWTATNIYDFEGDTKPQDWTHLNDVEVIRNRTFVLSMRNMDEVVFVKPGVGYLPDRTLGENDNRTILFEQHNPDYIPKSRGGPALLVGDSENNRIVEYQRIDGNWIRTWTWRDARMQWPRDADRLPNGRTLAVDTHGDRVMELSPNGSVAWQVTVGMPYDVERLGTGDESTGGHSIRSIENSVDDHLGDGIIGRVIITIKDAVPAVWVNSLLFVGPAWFRFSDLLTAAFLLMTLGSWTMIEYRWGSWSLIGAVIRTRNNQS